ncbi:hypothetical protein ARSEF1564_009301 [Beauveria bassiana]
MLALLGFACLAAGYSIAGSVERMYFYYAYKLDTLTPGNQVIAPGCKDCNLDQFIKHISKDKNIKSKTAQKIADEGLTGVIEIGQVVKDAKNNYASLLQKVGDRVIGKLSSSPKSPELLADFEKAKAGVYEAMKGVYNERMRAAAESLKPFPGEAEAFTVVEKEKGRDLSNLQKSITLAQELVCPAGSSRRMMKRQGQFGRARTWSAKSDAHWAAAIEELRKKEAADGVVEVPPAKLKRTLVRSSSGYRSEIAASMQ